MKVIIAVSVQPIGFIANCKALRDILVSLQLWLHSQAKMLTKARSAPSDH